LKENHCDIYYKMILKQQRLLSFSISMSLRNSNRWAKARFACFCPSGAVITAAGLGAKRAIAHQRLDATSSVKLRLTADAAS
jgi:hypothetical protein